MKTISFSIFFVITVIFSEAQIDTKIINYNNKADVILENEIAITSFTNKINSVKVIDARDDTSALGYLSISSGGAGSKKDWPKIYYFKPSYSIDESIEKWVSNYLQLNTSSSQGNGLLIVIKKLWISSEAAPILHENDKRGQPNEGWDGGIVSKLEFYLQKDSAFYPLFRVDSIFTLKDKLPDSAGAFIRVAIKNSLIKLYQVNLDEVISKRRKLIFNEILISNAKKLQLPILNCITYKKGVYKNFEEFKTNSPSISEYELRKGQLGDILYVKDNKEEYPERNAWGFCDGTNLFINSGDKYSKLLKQQNTFYFTGIKGSVRQVKHDLLYTSLLNLATNTGRKKTSFKVIEKYYQVDMESGEAY